MVAVTLANVILPLSVIVGAQVLLAKTAALDPAFTRMVEVWAGALGLFVLVTGLSAAALSPAVPHWRINALTDQSAASLHRAIVIWVGLVALVDAAYILLMGLVRMLQGFVANRVLAHAVSDVGVRDSVTAGIGYAGVAIAVLVALSALGLEMTQLALIFGALSLGVGFGLQHIVHNFVSGLILLMQRPIKAGDWIVVGSREGYVRKINVMATEIETFDNSTLIVPNSTLVSSEVLNWTHKSKVGRVIVRVGVAVDADPEAVREVLLQCASQNPDVMQRPAPNVLFQDFADSSYEFELRFYVREADSMLSIASEMRFAINEAFKRAGIRIPFPQHDIHIQQASDPPRKF